MYLLKTEKDKTYLFFTKTFFFTWNMAGRLCSCGSLVICVIVLRFSGKPRMSAEQVSLGDNISFLIRPVLLGLYISSFHGPLMFSY